MVTIKKISKSVLPELVKISYEGDNDLIEKYHVAKTDFEGSVKSTVDMINDAAKELEADKGMVLEYYKVIYNKEPIGYFVIVCRNVGDILYSFAINIKYRKKDILIMWWEEMKKTLSKNFLCFLYDDNTRAAKFLVKNGMVSCGKEDNVVGFVYNN